MNAVYPDLSSETTAIRLAARGPQLARATKARQPRPARKSAAQKSESAILTAITALAACTPDERSEVLAQIGLAACPA